MHGHTATASLSKLTANVWVRRGNIRRWHICSCMWDCRLRIELFWHKHTLTGIFYILQSTHCTHAHTDTQHIAFAIHYYCVNLRLNLVQFISTVEWIWMNANEYFEKCIFSRFGRFGRANSLRKRMVRIECGAKIAMVVFVCIVAPQQTGYFNSSQFHEWIYSVNERTNNVSMFHQPQRQYTHAVCVKNGAFKECKSVCFISHCFPFSSPSIISVSYSVLYSNLTTSQITRPSANWWHKTEQKNLSRFANR